MKSLIHSLGIVVCLSLLSCTGQNYEKMQDGIIINVPQAKSGEAKKVRLQVVNDKVIHVSATPGKTFSQEESLIIIPQAGSPTPFAVAGTDQQLTLNTAALQVTVNRQTGEVAFADKNGNAILRENAGGGKTFTPVTVEGTKAYAMRQVFESPDDEAFYGLGQHQSDEFNYKGKNETLFQYNTKVSVPFILSNKNYGILWDNYSLSRFGDPREYAQLNENFTLFDAEGKEGGLTAVYTPANNEEAVVERTESTIYYEDIKTVKNLPKDFPLSGSHVNYTGEIASNESGAYRFHLYYAGYVKVYLNNELIVPERWRNAWNPNSYKFTAHLKAGKRVPLRIEWEPDGSVTYLGLRTLSPVSEREQNKLSIHSEIGNEIDYYFVYGDDMDEVISGYRTLTGKAPIMPKWAMGFWQSGERYKTQEEILPKAMIDTIHATHALIHAQAIYEGLREKDPNSRVFQLTRWGFAGLQRYATATWSGDIATRWEDMKAQISSGINLSMSGIPYWTMDIGSFCVENRYVRAQEEFNRTGKENADLEEWRELNTRWYQFGTFTPLFRSHGQYPFGEMYNMAPENHPAYKSIVAYTKLRYRMMPYIYSLAGNAYFHDYTITRGLVMDFGRDKQVENIGDQYMFGPSLMVCPVYEYGARCREIYFPATTSWYDFYTGKYIRGGQQQTVSASYEQIPLFYREGTILPCGPEIEYVDQKLPESITLYVYAGQNAVFTLYEDEGVNYNYEKGQYSMIPLTYDEASRTLVIGDRQGEYPGMLKKRVFNVVVVDKNNAKAFDADAKGVEVAYSGRKEVVKL